MNKDFENNEVGKAKITDLGRSNQKNKIIRLAVKEDYLNYLIYSDGRVMNQLTGRFLNTKKKKETGYYMVSMRSNKGEKKTFLLHRLLWEVFIGKIPQGKQINHIDENKGNNILYFDN